MADAVHYCPYCNRHSCHVAVHVEDKCEAAQIADAADEMEHLRLALETATRERDEARANISEVIEPEFFDKIMAAAVSEKEMAALREERDGWKASYQTTEEVLGWVRAERDEALRKLAEAEETYCREHDRLAAPPADAATEAVREAAERLLEDYEGVEDMLLPDTAGKVLRLRTALAARRGA